MAGTSILSGTGRIRSLALIAALAVLVALAPLATSTPAAVASPVADNPETYALCGRVFPDPQAYWANGLGEDTPHPGVGSPFAKGNAVCAARHYLGFEETIAGLRFMADELDVTRDFVDLIDLSRTDEFDDVLQEELGDGHSEGNGTELGGRDERPLYMVRVTAPENARLLGDAVAPVPMAERDHFAWALSIHGIERAGAEGGIRAIEDLATWASQEPERLLLETEGAEITTEGGRLARNLPVGEVMMRSVSYFVLPNPDGWTRGDVQEGSTAFQRFNGNGMDLNRDWPEIGYTDPSFTPWSESESRSIGRALQSVSDEWTGGIDLHGMVEANAFSYTLLGGSQRPYDENERIMEFVEQAWRDAETRLAWSPIIKPNDAPEQCVEFAGVLPNGDTHLPPGEQCDQRSYGVQYGTIWDTIEYTATGALGNWIDSPIGLDADGIDNEMMLSHLGNCGVGTCYVAEAEQLHVDGNKGLIYSMLNFELEPVDGRFDLDGTNVGYLVNPRRLVDPGVTVRPTPADAVDMPDIAGTTMTGTGDTVLAEFTVDNDGSELGPLDTQYYVAGISGSVRFQNVTHQSVHVGEVRVQRFDDATQRWVERPTYGSDGAVYRVAGDHSDWNYPADGRYRVIANTLQPMRIGYEVEISTAPVWDDPVQAAFDVSNMDFFTELEPYLAPGTTLTAVDVDEVLSGERDLSDFDTVIAVDGAFLPGFVTELDTYETYSQGLLDLPATTYTASDAQTMGARLADFARQGGNVVLTDDAVQAVAFMDIGLSLDDVAVEGVYAGHAVFSNGYDHPLAAGTNNPGAAEGAGGRRQTAEPLPIGYSIEDGEDNMPNWGITTQALAGVDGTVVTTTDGADDLASIAEIPVGAGVVRTFASVLTFPTTAYFHPHGLSSYGLTDHGYTLLDNLMTWQNDAQSTAPDLADDDIIWMDSDVPTRVMVDGSNRLPEGFIIG